MRTNGSAVTVCSPHDYNLYFDIELVLGTMSLSFLQSLKDENNPYPYFFRIRNCARGRIQMKYVEELWKDGRITISSNGGSCNRSGDHFVTRLNDELNPEYQLIYVKNALGNNVARRYYLWPIANIDG
jgi:hypothetical protein